MALHGPIQVNDEVIGSWQARRQTPTLDPGGIATYDCAVVLYGDQPPRIETFRMRHRYDDGALVLASKVLAQAVELRSGGDHG